MGRSPVPAVLAVLAVLASLSGCVSSDDGPDPFERCGNMLIERNEQCDDGNASDIDDCLSTCVFNQCGDEFLNARGPMNVEMCDGRNLNNRNCFSLGFVGGTLSCAGDCTFDTSACIPAPTATPSGPAALAQPTPTATAPAG
jgi:cysteine-rich repeat protein